MNVIVLGGAGFIGSHLVRSLLRNCAVTSISRRPPVVEQPGVRYVCDTLDNTRMLADLVVEADAVFHLASDTTPGSSELQPSIEATNNLLPTLRLLELLQSYRRVHLVYVSSGGAVYGENNGGHHREDSRVSPPAYYGAGKAAVEMFLAAYNQQTDNRVTIVRPSNVYGPGQRAKRTFGLIPTIFRCLDSGAPLNIWGDGGNLRDYLYIEDCVDLLSKAVARPGSGGCEIFNAGFGKAHSILEVCRLIEEITGRRLDIRFHPRRRVDLGQVTLDSSRAAELLDWQPAVPLREGLEQVAREWTP